MIYFKAAPIAALVLFGSLTGCSSEVARPMTVTCGQPRAQVVQRVSQVFTSNGYQITAASADAGTVQAVSPNTSGAGIDYQRKMWTVATQNNDMIVNASVITKESGSSSETVRFVDESNMMAGDAAWFQPVMNGLRNVCSTPVTTEPSNPGTIESTPRR